MEAVTDAYLNPPQGMEDAAGHMQLKQLAEEFSITPLKVRKLLIITGAYQTAISKTVNVLFAQGKTVQEIQNLTNLSRASVQSYLPYSKTVYKMEERTLLAERLRFYYVIKGNEIFFSRKGKSVTRATANIALETAVKLQKEGFVITGPKKLRCFGASYLYPVFIRIGVIQNGDKCI